MLTEQLSTATAVANGTVARSVAGEGVSSLLTDSYPLLSMVAALPLFLRAHVLRSVRGGAKEGWGCAILVAATYEDVVGIPCPPDVVNHIMDVRWCGVPIDIDGPVRVHNKCKSIAATWKVGHILLYHIGKCVDASGLYSFQVRCTLLNRVHCGEAVVLTVF